MNERQYQAKLIKKLHAMFPGCFIQKNDPRLVQGVPDILILYKDHWAFLEVKISERAAKQPNQGYYIDMFDEMSFASMIYPENEEAVLNELQHAFGFARQARVS
jgi:hypothetical protein